MSKIGYSILAFTFVKLKATLSPEETEKARKVTKEKAEQSQFGIVMLERGVGLGYDGCIVSLYRNYSEYAQQRRYRGPPFIDNSKTKAFLINLEDNVRYRPLSFQAIARQLSTRVKKEETESE